MAGPGATRIQLCGRYVAVIDGTRVEDKLPGRRGRAVFAYLVLHRGRPVTREDLMVAGWGGDAPAETASALSVLLSKFRKGLGTDLLHGRTEVELVLPAAVFVDAEAAQEGAHRAESAIAQGQWAQAWGPAGIAYHVATRPFLIGLEASWIDEWRRRLEDIRLRGLECFAAAGLGLGGPALAQAEERARLLTEFAPFRESGHTHPDRGIGETRKHGGGTPSLRTAASILLREELGISPNPTSRPPTVGCFKHRQLTRVTTIPPVRADRHGSRSRATRGAGPHVTLGIPQELILVLALNDISAHADDPQRHADLQSGPPAIIKPESLRAQGPQIRHPCWSRRSPMSIVRADRQPRRLCRNGVCGWWSLGDSNP